MSWASEEGGEQTMEQKEIVLYTGNRSLRSWRAKRLLAHRGYHFEVIGTTDAGLRTQLKQLRCSDYRQTVPYLFVDHRPVGGFGEIKSLDSSGTLALLIGGAV